MTLVLIGSKVWGLLGKVESPAMLRIIRSLAAKALKEPLSNYYKDIGSNKSTIKLLFYLCALEGFHYDENKPDRHLFSFFNTRKEGVAEKRMILEAEQAKVISAPKVVVDAFYEFLEECDGPKEFSEAFLADSDPEDKDILLTELEALSEWILAEVEDCGNYRELDVACITLLYCLLEAFETNRAVSQSNYWLRTVGRIMDNAAEDYVLKAWRSHVERFLRKEGWKV